MDRPGEFWPSELSRARTPRGVVSMAVEDDKPRMLFVIRLDDAMGDMGDLWGGN